MQNILKAAQGICCEFNKAGSDVYVILLEMDLFCFRRNSGVLQGKFFLPLIIDEARVSIVSQRQMCSSRCIRLQWAVYVCPQDVVKYHVSRIQSAHNSVVALPLISFLRVVAGE